VRVEVMPPHTNRGPSFPGSAIRLGGRKPAASSCRDEVLVAMAALSGRNGRGVFTVSEVYAEMRARRTPYVESTVFKTMQRMKKEPARPPYVSLDRAGKRGFQLAATRPTT